MESASTKTKVDEQLLPTWNQQNTKATIGPCGKSVSQGTTERKE
jgi:hypothetical protein